VGHTRLGELPRSLKWQQVVALLAGGAGAAQVATATIAAAERGLNLATEDPGLVETVYLLMQLPLAARAGDFAGALRAAGLDVPDDPGVMDVVGAFSDAVDARLANASRRDLGEMAQMAACETITAAVGGHGATLFGAGADDVRAALAGLGTVARFGAFARQFVARLTTRVLGYYLSRAVAGQTGEGRRFATLAEHAGFERALERHAGEASAIVERFSGEWFSKTRWEENGQIEREAASHFAFGAMQKMVAELKAGAHHHG
jgi:hypothetical protein